MTNGTLRAARIFWIAFSVLLILGAYIVTQANQSSAVAAHEVRLGKVETSMTEIKESLIEIRSNQKWMMRRMK